MIRNLPCIRLIWLWSVSLHVFPWPTSVIISKHSWIKKPSVILNQPSLPPKIGHKFWHTNSLILEKEFSPFLSSMSRIRSKRNYIFQSYGIYPQSLIPKSYNIRNQTETTIRKLIGLYSSLSPTQSSSYLNQRPMCLSRSDSPICQFKSIKLQRSREIEVGLTWALHLFLNYNLSCFENVILIIFANDSLHSNG